MNQGNPSSSSTGKLKFTPKPSRRKPPNRSSQPTSGGADIDADSEQLLKSFQERLQGRRRKTENAPVRVAFGPGAITPASSGTEVIVIDGEDPESGRSNLDSKERNISSSSAGKTVKIGSYDEDMKDAFGESSSEDDVYREPWDYERTYYPTALPLRKPHSGDPVILDDVEFGEAARNAVYNEENINAAEELGLLEKSQRQRLLFFQLPHFLPSMKGSTTKGKEAISQTAAPSKKLCGWEDLPAGHMGKLVVFKSGAVKLKLGENLYDVSPGSAGKSSNEDVVAVNIKTKDCCRLGRVEKHAVVSLDVDSILDSVNDQ